MFYLQFMGLILGKEGQNEFEKIFRLNFRILSELLKGGEKLEIMA